MRLDQHFMIDRDVIKKIVSLSGVKKGDTILEIGPGRGSLTRELARRGRIIAVEKDSRLAHKLRREFPGVEVITGNALKEIKKLEFSRIVSNMPYSICEPLFQRLPGLSFELALLTVPRGFADRILKGEGGLPGKTRSLFRVRALMEIPRESFEPRPGTGSVLLGIEPKNPLLNRAFSMPRKKVKNAIMEAICTLEKSTKNRARKRIKTLKINNSILEKTVNGMTASDLMELSKALKGK